ncbi:Mediator complex subunit 15 [Hirschfeldia incana]|nr:Mediator complex subunit 15 [Hirschfeldia incana]
MEGNSNWKPNQQGRDSLASNNANDWRSQLEPDMRKKVILAIVEKLKIYYPTRHPNELKNTALSFEGKIHGVATDKDDYMRKIKGNIMSFDRKFRTLQSSNVQSGSSANATNAPAPAAQALNQGQSVPTSSPYTQTPTSQQWIPQNNNIQSNPNIFESSGLPNQVSSAAQNLNIQMGEGVHANLLPGSQRQIHGREQLLSQQPHSSNYFQNQMDQQLLKEEVQPPYMQQPSLLKQTIKQEFPPHQTSLSSIQQSFPQPSAISSQSSGQHNSQFLPRENQFPAQRVHSSYHQQQLMSVPSQEQKRQEREKLISHLMNDQDTQQNQLTSLQNNGEQQRAFRVSSSQQNNIASFQERPLHNNNIQQRLYSHSNNASALPSQQQQYNVHVSSSLGAQGQEVGQSQPMIQQQYQPKHHMQQQPQNRILQQPLDDIQRFQAPSSLLQNQQNQSYQLQRNSPANPSTSQDSTGKTVNASGGGDWQEEAYQKIEALKEKYILVLSTLFQRISNKLREIDALPQQKIQHGPIEKLRASQAMLKQVLVFLNVPRSGITEMHRDRFSLYEAQLLKFVKPNQTLTRMPLQHQQQQVHLPPSQTQQTLLQSQSDLTTSHTAMPHSLQTRPKMEPKEESNIMTSSGHVPSLKQNHASNPQQKQFHHLPMQHQVSQRQQKQPQTNHQQQLQMPKNEMNDVRMRQDVNTKAGLPQQHISPSQRHLAKPMASLNFSPSASSPQIQNYSSPQLVEQQIIPTTFNKTRISSQSGGSSFVAPSPVTSFAPSQDLGDPQNPISVESSASQDYQLQPEAPEHFTLPPEPNAERPIDRLIKAFQSSSPESLAQSISEMSSVISLTDRLAGSVQSFRGSRGGVAQDLSERTRLRLEQGKTNPTKRFKRSVTTLPIDITSETDSYKQFSSLESEADSTASSGSKVNKIEPGLALLQEIVEVNGRLVETMVSICSEDVGPSEVTTGTIVTCSYAPVALSDTFQALYKSGHVSQIQPLRLLVPENYPHSPILIENIPFDSSVNKHEDLSARTRSRFGLSMKEFSEPMSLTEIAQSWDACARATMAEYAERHGGGTFSSKYGHWETVLRA